MFVHHQINNNSGINIIYKQSSTICIAKLLYTIMMLTVITLLAGCNSPAKGVYNDSDYNEAVSTAKTTPFGAYPDTIEYTLGKMTSVNNSNMPAMDTYTDNAYTRYIKSVLNVQNVDVFEANDSQYNTNVSMAVSMNRLPDIMVVSSQSELEQLIENGMIEDLTVEKGETYEQTAVREVNEEAGADVRIRAYIGSTNYSFKAGHKNIDKIVH